MEDRNPKYSSKYYLKKELLFILNSLHNVKIYLELNNFMIYSEGGLIFNKKMPYIYNRVKESMVFKMFLEFARLFDTQKTTISIDRLITKYNKHNILFKEKMFYLANDSKTNKKKRIYLNPIEIKKLFNVLEEDRDKYNDLINVIRTIRDKALAHTENTYLFDNKKFTINNSVNYNQFKLIVDVFYNDIHEIYKSIYGVDIVYEEDFSSEVFHMMNLLKRDTYK